MAYSPENVPDEPLTPAGRLFLRPEANTIVHCVIGVKHHMDMNTIKSTIKSSLMLKHPRFCSLLVHDKNGFEHWRRTEVDIDKHIILVDTSTTATATSAAAANRGGSLHSDNDVEKIVNDYLADLSVSTPLNTEKPLWEVHIMMEQKCAIFRLHHALGDGITLMSMLLEICKKAEDPEAIPTLVTGGRRNWRGEKFGKDWREVLVGVFKMVWFSFVFCLELVLRCLWVCDRKTVVSGGEGVELWPRKVATARFCIEDMKVVKEAIANATINDVLFGMISAGLSRYLEYHQTSNSLQKDQQITGVAMVNLREQSSLQNLIELMQRNLGSRRGNKLGIFLLPIYYHAGIEPLQHVKRAKAIIDKKKQTLEAYFSSKVADLAITLLGPKVASMLNYRIHCNTTFVISNVVGPKEEITIAGNPITFIRVITSSLPQAIAMHMVSYAGRADMQIGVAKDIIPDPEFLAKCFEDSLLEMKEAALATI